MPSPTNPNQRQDFVLLFDVTDGNPNGDPDAGNLPRVDPETMQGLVTDVCLKRKVRDWVAATKGNNPNFKIYVEHGVSLNEQHQRAYDDLKIEPTGSKQDSADIDKTRAWMCQNFYDIRMFGAVMTTGVNCGQVRGPVQLTFARSIDPITPLDISITRVAVTRAEDDKETEMGRKSIVPYGLYRAHGFFTPSHARATSASEEDLALFWDAMRNMWDLDRSASRGMVACRGLYVFSHENALGNAPAHELFDLVDVEMKSNVRTPRSFNDYDVSIDNEGVTESVTLTSLVG